MAYVVLLSYHCVKSIPSHTIFILLLKSILFQIGLHNQKVFQFVDNPFWNKNNSEFTRIHFYHLLYWRMFLQLYDVWHTSSHYHNQNVFQFVDNPFWNKNNSEFIRIHSYHLLYSHMSLQLYDVWHTSSLYQIFTNQCCLSRQHLIPTLFYFWNNFISKRVAVHKMYFNLLITRYEIKTHFEIKCSWCYNLVRI